MGAKSTTTSNHPSTPPKGVAMPEKNPLCLNRQVVPAVRAPAPADDLRLQMRREMMKESLWEMMAMMPRECNPAENRCSQGTGQAGAHGPHTGASIMAITTGSVMQDAGDQDYRLSG